ncbi:MAG TPA: phosphotransferase [Terriglobales bacterium]|nr:phosphotransferase [Terriglobales bacterium]
MNKDAKMRECVAAALDLAPRHILITRIVEAPEQRSIRAWGSALGKKFFAKTLVRDPYMVMPRVTNPWGDTAAVGPRPAQTQIEIEWEKTLELQRLAGSEHIAAPLGRSLAAKTIVWQDLEAEPLDELVKRRHWTTPRSSMRAALRQAGEWLRKLHERSAATETTVDLGAMLDAFRDRACRDGQLDTIYGRSAIGALESGLEQVGRSELRVPTALSHGDFFLANLVWNKQQRRMYVIDYENFAPAVFCQDQLSMIFDLRSQLMNPLIPKSLLLSLEKEFWAGYGPVEKPVLAFINAVAAARVFYFHLPRAINKRLNKGGVVGTLTAMYKMFLEPSMVVRCTQDLSSEAVWHVNSVPAVNTLHPGLSGVH